jgi:hypothetical protein
MARIRPPALHAEYARQVIRQIAGSSKLVVVLVALALILASSVSGNALWGIVQVLLARSTPADFSWPAHWLGAVMFPSLRLGLWVWARSSSDRVRPILLPDDNPPPAKALVLFLSQPGEKDRELAGRILAEDTGRRLATRADREAFGGSWRMPLEAIAHHLARLRTVVVIASADSKDSKRAGTHRETETFCRLVARMLDPEHKIELFDLATFVRHYEEQRARELASHQRSLKRLLTAVQQALDSRRRWSEWLGSPESPGKATVAYGQGVDFEDPKELVDAVEAAHDLLRARGIPSYDILIDVTGGQKPCTVAGAVVSLAEGRRFQGRRSTDRPNSSRAVDLAKGSGLRFLRNISLHGGE